MPADANQKDTQAKEVLLGLGLSSEQVEGVIAGIGQQKKNADESGVRRKSFDLETAQETITGLQTQLKTLTDQIAALDLAKTAAKALDAEAEARNPPPEQFTIADFKTAMTQAFTEAVTPIIEKQAKETEALTALLNQINEINNTVSVAQKQVNELSGELPRALRVAPQSRYSDAVGVNGDRPAVSQKEENDSFGWIDDYLQGIN